MIDTIKIRLPLREAPDEISELFHPISLNALRFNSKAHQNTRFNPGKILAKRTEYTPTYIGEKFLTNGAATYYLAIEASLPKLLFGNNIDELERGEESMMNVVHEIKHSLENDLKLSYTEDELLSSEVAKLHVGKNFVFNDPGAPLSVIDTIYKSRADRLCDDNQTKYENLGFSFRLHTNNKEVIYYDKKKDIEQSKKSPKRAIDGSITTGLDDGDSVINKLLSNKTAGVLRLEVRLNNRSQIRKAFPAISEDLSFRNVYLNAPILNYLESEWRKSTDTVSAVKLSMGDASKTFEAIAAQYSLRDGLAVATAITIINDHGMNYFRSLVEKYHSKDAWYRFKRLLNFAENHHPSYFKKINEEIREYTPVSLQKIVK